MNAILRRELITLLRTRRAVAVQLGLALAFALLIGLRWPTESQVASVIALGSRRSAALASSNQRPNCRTGSGSTSASVRLPWS